MGLVKLVKLNSKAELPEVSQHSSQAERRAIDAERDTDAMKKS